MLFLLLLRAILAARASLALENLALRQQVAVLKRSVRRPRIRPQDRIFWLALRRLWTNWRESLLIVQPATVIHWHRRGWQLWWRWRSCGKPGRPPISLEVRDLIRQLSLDNRLWGAPRIQDELEHLGHHVAKSTIERYMARRHGPPSGTWRAFLRNHASEILACDFFQVPSATFKTLTGFVVMDLGRRRIVACDVTSHPTALWAASIVRRAVFAARGSPRYLLRDRDAIYGDEFKTAMRRMKLRQIVSAYHSPLQNAHAERVIGTIRRECLDHVIVLGEAHARRILNEFVGYYDAERAHQSLEGDAPETRSAFGKNDGRVIATSHLGGLHHSYRRAA